MATCDEDDDAADDRDNDWDELFEAAADELLAAAKWFEPADVFTILNRWADWRSALKGLRDGAD